MASLWPIGSASGYHPVTFGFTAGEIFRRVDGRTMGTALREDLAQPLDLDIWIGLPDSEHARCAELMRPTALPKFGEINDAVKAAFMTKWAAPGGRGTGDWRAGRDPLGQRPRHRPGPGPADGRPGLGRRAGRRPGARRPP